MPDFILEQKAYRQGFKLVCGVDEAGRGSLAGPVVSAAVVVHQELIPLGLLDVIDDSKKMKKKKREEVLSELMPLIFAGVGIGSVCEIDRLNILEATMLSMRRAVKNLDKKVDLALIDGNSNPDIFGVKANCVIKGDERCISISVASILAKVTRDQILVNLSKKFPGYGWAQNAGYGTKQHKEAISVLGITTVHRKSFKPIRKMLR